MPTQRELVSNKALGGTELAAILRTDFSSLLESHGLLSGQMAFSRVRYEIRLTLHLDIPSLPLTTDSVRSRAASDSDVAAAPALAALEPAPPLPDPSPSAILTSDELARDITSPNVARLEAGLPIEVTTRDNDGHSQERLVQYPSDFAGHDPAPPVIRDVTAEERASLGLPADPDDLVMASIVNSPEPDTDNADPHQ